MDGALERNRAERPRKGVLESLPLFYRGPSVEEVADQMGPATSTAFHCLEQYILCHIMS